MPFVVPPPSPSNRFPKPIEHSPNASSRCLMEGCGKWAFEDGKCKKCYETDVRAAKEAAEKAAEESAAVALAAQEAAAEEASTKRAAEREALEQLSREEAEVLAEAEATAANAREEAAAAKTQQIRETIRKSRAAKQVDGSLDTGSEG
jgi:hypothetical protein